MMEYFKRTSVNRQTKKIISYLLMTAIGIVLITPLLWMVFTSLKPMEEIVRYPPTFFPEKIVWQNYLDTITAFPFWRYARNTLLITVLVVFGNAFNIFLMRQFYLSINDELIEAAEIDGANHFYIWSRLMLPLTKPALITIAINSFNAAWNDFLGPLLYIQDQEKYTLQIGLQVFQNQATTQWNYLMAGATLVLIPTILMFFFAQRYFIEGMDLTGGSKG